MTSSHRFLVGPTPIPDDAKVDPALVATNGYDFNNNVNGDTYVWLLGNTLDEWNAARQEFVSLAGPCPVLPVKSICCFSFRKSARENTDGVLRTPPPPS